MAQADRQGDWLLLETFSTPSSATVIAQGSTTKAFLPLDKIIRSTTHRTVVEAAIAGIRQQPFPRDFTQGDTRYVFLPLQDYEQHLSAILFHYGPADEPIADPPACGAWNFDLGTGIATGSDAMHDLHRVPEEHRFRSRPIHESLSRIVGPDPSATAKLINKQPGQTHQSTETVTSEDGSLWIASYTAGFLRSPEGSMRVQGVTRRIGDYQLAPSSADLSDQIVRAISKPGLFRAIVDPTTGNFLRSYDPPLVGGTQDIRQAVMDDDEADTLMKLISNCLRDNVAVTSVPMHAADGSPVTVELFPLELEGARAVLASFLRKR